MTFKKLNNTFDADPNVPLPVVSIHDPDINLQFFLNYFIHKEIGEDEEAILTFHEVHMYRLGSTNDEGFYLGQCRFSRSGIEWGDFYELTDSNWRATFPADRRMIMPALSDDPDLRHYLFYFREETFECIAKRYDFRRIGIAKRARK